jgi:hypothetical protein
MCQAPDDLYELDTTVCDVPAHHGDTAIGRHKADAELIASAPSDLTYLASALSAAEERVEDLEAALQRIADLPSGAIPGHAVAVGCRHNIVAWKALNAPGGTECEACDGKGWNMDYGPWRTEGVPNTPGYRVTTVHAEQGDFTVTMGRQIPCPAGCDHGWLAPTQAAEGER